MGFIGFYQFQIRFDGRRGTREWNSFVDLRLLFQIGFQVSSTRKNNQKYPTLHSYL